MGQQEQGTRDFDTPMLSRRPGMGELRVLIDQDLINAVEAEVIVRGGAQAGVHHATIVAEVLRHWAAQKRHSAIVWARVAGLNPTPSEGAGSGGGS